MAFNAECAVMHNIRSTGLLKAPKRHFLILFCVMADVALTHFVLRADKKIAFEAAPFQLLGYILVSFRIQI